MNFPVANLKSLLEKYSPNNSVKNFLLFGPNRPMQEYLSVTSLNFIFLVKLSRS